MNLRKYIILLAFINVLFWSGCEKKPKLHTTYFSGQITVSDSLDASKDYGGIELLIIKRDSLTTAADTLFYSVTNQDGTFAGLISYPVSGSYPLFISRHKNRLYSTSVLLGVEDSLFLKAELPNFNTTKSFKSVEYEALNTVERLNRNLSRIGQYAISRQFSQDSIITIRKQWADLYWSVYVGFSKTMAGSDAAVQSLHLLSGISDSLLISRYEQLYKNLSAFNNALPLVIQVKSRHSDFEILNNYMKNLEDEVDDYTSSFMVASNRFDILYDSLRIDEALRFFNTIKKKYKSVNQIDEWISYNEPYITSLKPGNKIPHIRIETVDGNVFDTDSLSKPLTIIEIVRINSDLYRNQFEEILISKSLFDLLNIRFITIPVDEPAVVNSFYEVFKPGWMFAKSGQFAMNKLDKKLSISYLPSRLVIDDKGLIIKHYDFDEFNDLINEVPKHLNNNKIQ